MHDIPNGNYDVRVRANRDDLNSNYSITVSFSVDRMFDHPTNLSIHEETVSWQAVDSAKSYVVRINGTDYPLTTTSMDLSFLDDNATYEVKVKAIFDLGESAFSLPTNHFTYYDVIDNYERTYNIMLSHNLLIVLDTTFSVDHVFYGDMFLDNDDFYVHDGVLTINYEPLKKLEVGQHIINFYTEDGIVRLSLEIVEDETPQMISSNSVQYVVNEDIVLLYEMFDGEFVGLSGHDIDDDDYHFAEGTLTIHKEYLDPKIATFEGSTIIFNYQLKSGDHITLGYIFIRIP